MCGFDWVRSGNYLGGEPIKRTLLEARLDMLKSGKDDITGEIKKVLSDRVVDWIWSCVI